MANTATMSDAQYAALTGGEAAGGTVARGRDATVATLIAMAGRRWVTLAYAERTVAGRPTRVIVGGDITPTGTRTLALERAQREAAARNAELVTVGRAARLADPFAAFATVGGPADDIPF